jgi:acetyltransferase-like isoleucine patch superfamily enzyme
LTVLKKRSLISKIRRMDLNQWMVAIGSIGMRLRSRFYYPAVFGSFDISSLLGTPLALTEPRYIHIGSGVTIRPGARLEVIVLHPERPPELRIGRNVGIEQNVHIVCHHRVIIGNDVSIAANCAIVDTTHPFDDIPADLKVGSMIQDDDASVEIGDGSFLGVGCVVLPNVRIGVGCVIGANSVVTRDIPNYSVAAGAPARVLRSISKLPVR